MFTATGEKVHNWLKKNPEITNNLWQLWVVRIAQQSYYPHCPSCTCKKTPQPPPRLLDLADIQNLRGIKLAPVFQQNDAQIRDSYNTIQYYAFRGRQSQIKRSFNFH